MPPSGCRGEKADGSPCGAPENLVDPETGFCPAHDPDNRERVREAARKGGEATRRRHRGERGVDTRGDKWSLETYADAKTWLEAIARAVLAGKVSHHEAKAAIKAIDSWMDAHEAGEVTDRLDELGDALAEWKETGDPSPVLELVR